MLSIEPARNENYCLDLAREDYYLKGGEPPGKWSGKGSELLGLSGVVKDEGFRALYRGLDPRSGSQLYQEQKGKRHFPAWDLTFSAPKSVSTAWSVASPELREKLQRLHDESVLYALSYVEREAAKSPRGRAGGEREPASGVAVARFEHGTSRAQDPQLHTHCILFNVSARADGSWGTLVGRPLYQEKMAAGALYRASFAEKLRELGFELKRSGRFFELAGVPKELMERHSNRRNEIRSAMERDGAKGARAASIYAERTRRRKGHVARDLLFGTWRETGKEFGFTEKKLDALLRRRAPVPQQEVIREALDITRDRLQRRELPFTRQDVVANVASALSSFGASPELALQATERFLAAKGVRPAGEENGRALFALAENLKAMKQLVLERKLAGLRRMKTPKAKSIERAMRRVEEREGRKLTDGEKEAVLKLVGAGPATRTVRGLSGTSLLSVLAVAARAHRDAGHDVHILSPWSANAGLLEGAVGMSKEGLLARLRPPVPLRAPKNLRTALGREYALLTGQDASISSASVTSFLKSLRSRSIVSAYLAAQKRGLSVAKVKRKKSTLGKALAVVKAPFASFKTKKQFVRFAEEARKPFRRLTRRSFVVIEQSDKVTRAELAAVARACNRAGATLVLLEGEGRPAREVPAPVLSRDAERTRTRERGRG